MAAPVWNGSSIGGTDAGGAWVANPASWTTYSSAIGDIVILDVLQDGSTVGAVTLDSATYVENLAGTDNAWTFIGTFPVGNPVVAYRHIWIGRRLSASFTPTATGSNSTSEDLYFRFYTFNNCSTGTALAEVIENALLNGPIFEQSQLTTFAALGTLTYYARAYAFVGQGPLKKVRLWLTTPSGSPTDNLVVAIQGQSGGFPNGTDIATASIPASSITSEAWYEFVFSSPVNLTPGTTYELVVRRSGSNDNSNYYNVGYLSTSGTGAYQGSGGWAAWLGDMTLELYGVANNARGTSASVADAGVQTLGPDRLALNFVGINDDNAISVFTGETGGDWVLAVAPYADSGGTDGAIGLQAAAIPGPNDEYWGVSSPFNVQGSGGTTEEFARKFTAVASQTITSVQFGIQGDGAAGTPGDDLIVEIQSDAAGVPSGTVVGTGGSITGAASLGSRRLSVALSAPVTASSTYWVVFRRSGARDTSNYYTIGNTAQGGSQAYVRDSGTWSLSGGGVDSLPISIFSGTGGTIDGGTFTQADGADGWGSVGFALIGTTPSQQEYTDSATTTVVLTASGVDVKPTEYTDTDTDRVALTPSSTEIHEIPDSASLLVDLQASGTELQAKLYTDSETDRVTLTPSHVEIREIPDSATVYVGIQISTTAEVQVFVESAITLVDLQADGSELKAHDYPDSDTALVDIQASTTAEDHTTFDSATVGNLLTPSATEIKAHDYSDTDTALVDLQASTTAEDHTTYDAETTPVAITPSGTDSQETSAAEWTDSDTGTVVLTASATELQEFVDSATSPVAITPSSADIHEIPDAATAPLLMSVSDVQIAETVDASTALVDIEASTTDIQEAVDSAETLIDIQVSSADIAILEDVNTIPLALTTSATEEHTTVDSGTVSELLTPSFTEVHEIVDATTTTVLISPSTSDVHEIPDASTITNVLTPSATEEHATYDSATNPLSLTVSATEGLSSEYLDADAALVDIQTEATELAEFVDSDTSTVDIQASGEELSERADAAETVETITPSGVDIFEGVDAETVSLVLTPLGEEYVPQILRPNADVDANNWQVTPLWEKVSDVNDSTYIYATAV